MNKLTQHLIKTLSGVDIKQLLEEKEGLSVSNWQLSSDLNLVKQEAAYFRTQCTQKQDELAELQAQLEKVQENTAGLEKQIEELNQRLQALDEEKVACSQRAEEAEARHKALQEQAALLEKEKETCQSQLTESRKREEALNAAAGKAAEALNALKQKCQEGEEACARTVAEKESLSKELKQLQTVLEEKEQAVARNEETLRLREQDIQDLHLQLEEMDVLKKQVAEIEVLRTQLAELEALKPQALKADELQEALDTLKEKLEGKEAEYRSLQEILEKEREDWQHRWTEEQQQAGEFEEERMRLSAELEKMTAQHGQVSGELLQAREASKQMEDALAKAQELSEKQQHELSDWEAKYNRGAQQCEALEKQLTEKEALLSQQQRELDEQLAGWKKDQELLQEQQTRTEALQVQVARLAELEQQVSELAHWKEVCQIQAGELQALNVRLQELQEQNAQLQEIQELLAQQPVHETPEVQAEEPRADSPVEKTEEPVAASEPATASEPAVEAEAAAPTLPEEAPELKPELKPEPEPAGKPALETAPEPEAKTESVTESATEPETESAAGLKTESEKAPEPAQDVRKNEKVCTEKPVAEKPVHKPESLLDAYQDMKNRLEESTLYYPFTRITTEPDGCQYIYESRTLQVKTELFTWGVEGREVITDEYHFIPNDEIVRIEGMDSPFVGEAMSCDFSEEGNAAEVAEALLMAICSYRPMHILYRDKNGRISERNLFWTCFLPANGTAVKLPDMNLFENLFNGEMDTEHIVAACAHLPEPRIFIINQILSIQIFDAFVTTARGIVAMRTGLHAALLAEQNEAAELIYQCLPDRFKDEPDVRSNRAHYWMLEGDFEKAAELYLSVMPDQYVGEGMTWADFNVAQFNEFIERGVQAERFLQLKEALYSEGWNIREI